MLCYSARKYKCKSLRKEKEYKAYCGNVSGKFELTFAQLNNQLLLVYNFVKPLCNLPNIKKEITTVILVTKQALHTLDFWYIIGSLSWSPVVSFKIYFCFKLKYKLKTFKFSALPVKVYLKLYFWLLNPFRKQNN